MSPTSYLTAPPRNNLIIITCSLSSCQGFSASQTNCKFLYKILHPEKPPAGPGFPAPVPASCFTVRRQFWAAKSQIPKKSPPEGKAGVKKKGDFGERSLPYGFELWLKASFAPFRLSYIKK